MYDKENFKILILCFACTCSNGFSFKADNVDIKNNLENDPYKLADINEYQGKMILNQQPVFDAENLSCTSLKSHEDLTLLEMGYFYINHAKASVIANLLKSEKNNFLSMYGMLAVDERTNTILVQDTQDKLNKIKDFIERLDIPIKQVLIESRIVFVMDDIEKAIGMTFSMIPEEGLNLIDITANPNNRFNIDLPVTLASGASNMSRLGLVAKLPKGILLDLELMALESEGLGKIISSPRLVASNQQQAYIESGEEIPYQEITSSGSTSIAFKKAVLRLEVTPQITLDNHIILDLKVNQDSRGAVTNGVPAINTRELHTKVLVADDETIVLGGIYQYHKTQNKMWVPFLGKLPLLGWLFRNQIRHHQKSALLIFVTPQIMKDGPGN